MDVRIYWKELKFLILSVFFAGYYKEYVLFDNRIVYEELYLISDFMYQKRA